MDDVGDLVVTPFKEIVEKARRAVENAGDNNPEMLKAARALLKEGERGLKRIEPLYKKHLEDHGFNFVASLKDNNEITNYRTELTELLWEFDDYIEPDEFDADKFTGLQSLSRKSAPKIYDILMRMKLEAPTGDTASSRGSVARLPTPTSPPLPSQVLGAAAPCASHRNSAGSSMADVRHATTQLHGMMHSPSSSEAGHDFAGEPPRPPSANPWDWQVKPGSDRRAPEEVGFDRSAVEVESPILHGASLNSDPNGSLSVVHPPPLNVNRGQPDHISSDNDDRRLSTACQQSIPDRFYGQQFYPSRPRAPTLSSFSIPENEVSEKPGTIPFFQPSTVYSPSLHSHHSLHTSLPMSADPNTHGDGPRSDLVSIPSPDSHVVYGSFASPGFSPVETQNVGQSSKAPEAIPAHVLAEMDCAPIPVESEVQRPSRAAEIPPEECKISDDSSFNLARGFCNGAKEVISGGIGVKRTKRPGFATAATVARCVDCLYELDFAQIETDVDKHDKGNFTRYGISFRLRFLQKSHISTKRADDVQYGCVFCVQQGHTIHKSDATVFFNPKTLFEHLARHPRPLPDVPGITVIDGEQVPEKYRNDYDIHFSKPPTPHPVIERAEEIASMPSGIAKDQARRLYGQRLLYDRSPALELAQAARISGIRWPAQYQGEWCFGWHDGNYASVPADLVRLELPPPSEIKYDRSSLVRARAQWKFSVKEKDKDKGEWLKFDKDEIITNISWAHPDHWCWTGTNSKGKSGIFPQVYIDTNTIQEPSGASAARAGSLSAEKVRSSSSMLSKFSIRMGSGRPPSLAGSTGSR